MTTSAPPQPATRGAVALLLAGFTVCLVGRVALGRALSGPFGVAQSVPAGLAFAAGLLALSAAAGTRVRVTRRAVLAGLGGAVLVCLPVGLGQLASVQPLRGAQGFVPWALAVTAVATAEEVFLRGTLYDAVAGRRGERWAIAVAAVVFALLHVPLYGWHVLPLDLAVGVVLGMLRQSTRTAAAPAVTHVLADLAGWFLR